MEIACRSPREIYDDALCQLHTDCVEALNLRAGQWAVYQGAARDALRKLRDDLVMLIEGGVQHADVAILARRYLSALSLAR